MLFTTTDPAELHRQALVHELTLHLATPSAPLAVALDNCGFQLTTNAARLAAIAAVSVMYAHDLGQVTGDAAPATAPFDAEALINKAYGIERRPKPARTPRSAPKATDAEEDDSPAPKRRGALAPRPATSQKSQPPRTRKPDAEFPCPHCPKTLTSQHRLTRHISIKHSHLSGGSSDGAGIAE